MYVLVSTYVNSTAPSQWFKAEMQHCIAQTAEYSSSSVWHIHANTD